MYLIGGMEEKDCFSASRVSLLVVLLSLGLHNQALILWKPESMFTGM